MTTERDLAKAWPAVYRPQDRDFGGSDLTFEPAGFIGSLPRYIWVTDVRNRSCVYFAARTTIVKPVSDQRCLVYTTLEHERDLMPQVIVARDGEGNSCRYEALDPRGAKK